MNELILRRRSLFGILIAAIALVSSFTTFGNGFTQDDHPIVVEDERVANPGLWHEYLNEAYWPAPMQRDLYRPLTSLLIGAEWQAGNGSPLTYKVMQVTFYLACCLAVFALALRLLVPWAALGIGLLFAAHPVHVEAVALAVNQSEVLVGLICAAAAAWYIGRRRGGPLTAGEHATLAAVTLVASHVKESGAMLPVLLFSAEVILGRTPWRTRIRPVASLIVWQTLAVVITLLLRSRIPFETVSGSFVAEAFEGESLLGRFYTMLSIVPEWLRLLLWPATLSADYSPQAILPAQSWGLDQSLGLAILLLVATLAWRVRKTLPVLVFGIAWCAVGLFPVSNVLLPTGIPLAERTLFLPSIGVMLGVGAVLARVPILFANRGRVVTWATAAMVVLVTVLGVSRSNSRHTIWRDNHQMWAQTVIDNPFGYRPRMALGTLLYELGWRERAIYNYEVAIQLWDKSWGAEFQLAQWYRQSGNCELATPHYQRVLVLREIDPARNSLVTCLAWLGRYEEAQPVAQLGLESEEFGPVMRVWLDTLAAAIAEAPRPERVTFPLDKRYLLEEPADSAATPE